MKGAFDLWYALRPCPACSWRSATRAGVCDPCRVRWLGPDATGSGAAASGTAGSAVTEPDLVALGAYRGDLGRLVRAAKSRPDRRLLGQIGTALGHRVRAVVGGADGDPNWTVVPVPGDRRRERRRGLDHARELATAVAHALGPRATLRPGLRRVRPTRPQARLSDAERRANLEGAIAWRVRNGLEGAVVLLVDDVLTTGATARACRAALQAAGADRIVVAVAARAR